MTTRTTTPCASGMAFQSRTHGAVCGTTRTSVRRARSSNGANTIVRFSARLDDRSGLRDCECRVDGRDSAQCPRQRGALSAGAPPPCPSARALGREQAAIASAAHRIKNGEPLICNLESRCRLMPSAMPQTNPAIASVASNLKSLVGISNCEASGELVVAEVGERRACESQRMRSSERGESPAFST